VAARLDSDYYLDVTHPAANKGSAVDFLSAVYLIPASCIAAIGDMPCDMPNDILMFEKSGTSIGLGNAQEFVQGETNFISCRNEEHERTIARSKRKLHLRLPRPSLRHL
jgi:hydroxymethylpyrimidine pyrophosphatase-like HAD family hydrolase